MAQKYASVPAKTLQVDLAVADTTLIISDILDWNGAALTATQFSGDYIPATLINDAKTKVEFILIDATTILTAATSGATIFKRGLNLYATGVQATDQTEVTANKLDWTAGETKVLIGTNPPYMVGTLTNRYNDELIQGTWEFLNTNIPKLDSYVAPTADAEFAPKKYVDDIAAGGTASIDRIVPAATAGATIAAGDLVYNDDTANEWLLCDADTATTVEQVQIGIAQGAGTNGNPITGGVLLFGLDSNQTGMTAGDVMFASNTAGGIASSAGTTERAIGKAHSATELFFDPFFFHMIKDVDMTKLEAITASASELNQLDGATITAAQLTEAGTFFGSTDMTGAEAETLTDGSSADALHSHATSLIDEWISFIGDKSDGLTELKGGSSTITRNPFYSTLATTASTNEYVELSILSPYSSPINWDNDFEFIYSISLSSLTNQDVCYGIGLGATNGAPADATSTERHASFMVQDGTLYASIADGTTQEKSSAIAGYTLTDYNTYRISFTAGGSVLFYINSTLVATLSTNVPTGAVSYELKFGLIARANEVKKLNVANSYEYLTKA